MTNKERIAARIARDKERKQIKRQEAITEDGQFEKVFTYQNLLKSLNKRIKGTKWKGSVQMFLSHAICKIKELYDGVRNGTYLSKIKIRSMTVYERGKRRDIQMVAIGSRVLQGCICDSSLLPLLSPTFIYDNPASTKGKGVQFARKRANKFLTEMARKYNDDFYALVFDIKSFFDNIPHAQCLRVMNPEWFDENIIKVTMDIIKKYKDAKFKYLKIDNFDEEITKVNNMEGVGITLGSQVSQVMALAVPNVVDHLIKDKLHIKHYIRYMDDGVILAKTKEGLHGIVAEVEKALGEIGLSFNKKKTRIVKMSKGFSFLKVRYSVTPTGAIVKRLAKSSIVRMRRKLHKFKRKVDKGEISRDDVCRSFKSWFGYARIAMCTKARRGMLNLYNKLFKTYNTEGVMV